MTTARRSRIFLIAAISPLILLGTVFAGGPLTVGGPGNGTQGQAFVWNPAAMPIQYRVDVGPLATAPGGQIVINNAIGLQRVQAMFANWQQAPHSAIQYQYAGPLQSQAGLPLSDVATLNQYDVVLGLCQSGAESPIIFDDNGQFQDGIGPIPTSSSRLRNSTRPSRTSSGISRDWHTRKSTIRS